MAQVPKTIIVHTYSSFASKYGLGPVVKQEFEAVCQCELKFKSYPNSGEMLYQLQNYGESVQADVILGYDESILSPDEAIKILTRHNIAKLDLAALKLSSPADDYSVPFDKGVFAFVYSEKNYPNPPKSMQELMTSPDKLILIDPRSETVGRGLLFWVKSVMNERAHEFWRAIKPKTITFAKGWSEAYGLFLKSVDKKQPIMVISYWTSPFYHEIMEKRTDIKAIEFIEGNYGQVELMGIARQTKNPELAQEFIKFMLSKKIQNQLPTLQWMMPVVSDAQVPVNFTKKSDPRVNNLPPELIKSNKIEWLKEWQTAH